MTACVAYPAEWSSAGSVGTRPPNPWRMSVPPWIAGSTDVSMDRCDGSVQDETLTASSAINPSRARASSRGVVGARYPYAPT